MSRYFSEKYASLDAYVPGEQPRDQQYVKLNTNENPFPPHSAVVAAATEAAGSLQLYSDPECTELRRTLAARLEIRPDELIMTNGSDEALYLAFLAFCDGYTPAVFPDVTYGFYKVYAQMTRCPSRVIPVKEDLSIDPRDYHQSAGTIFLANPNAPTGIALPKKEIEEILETNPYNAVVVDEAYVDFGAESCLKLIRDYDNLLVVGTFSKSRSLAGARLGFAAGNPELIRDLNTLKYSMNPYNVNRMTQAAGVACLEHDDYNRMHCLQIAEIRDETAEKLKDLGFEMTRSRTNFLFVKHPAISGEELYKKLKRRGVLVRHFSDERIREYNRISVGDRKQMERLLSAVRSILEGLA